MREDWEDMEEGEAWQAGLQAWRSQEDSPRPPLGLCISLKRGVWSMEAGSGQGRGNGALTG